MDKKDIEYFQTNPTYNFKEFSELCGVNRPTLIYWQKKGCMSCERDPQNDYRIYDMMCSFNEIYCIKHYKRMGLSLKQISQVYFMSPDELTALYKKKEVALNKQIDEMQNALDSIKSTIDILKKTKNFKVSTKTIVKEFPFKYIYSINTTNKQLLHDRLQNKLSALSVRPVLEPISTKPEDYKTIHGYASNKKYDSPIIWQKDSKSRFFNTIKSQKEWATPSEASAGTIFPTDTINQTVLDLAPNRQSAKDYDLSHQPRGVEQFVLFLQELGFTVKNVLYCWLTNLTIDGEWRQFHDTYIEF